MSESREIITLRQMAWERAKGELRDMMQTYWENENFDSVAMKVETFIKDLEDNELG